ncbi:hypothetical protein DERP_003015 [Dermatophagoides pteronyssinus]|uniref:Uncharacterized protein n=1 Tax=Dermatophagoides pteronyssinus TaxID=6956 RepID=A0ABQ8JIV8_DERPT|nr:hypothetical protein DERP_003015 [Dermatophagoides pteronyssinus]
MLDKYLQNVLMFVDLLNNQIQYPISLNPNVNPNLKVLHFSAVHISFKNEFIPINVCKLSIIGISLNSGILSSLSSLLIRHNIIPGIFILHVTNISIPSNVKRLVTISESKRFDDVLSLDDSLSFAAEDCWPSLPLSNDISSSSHRR